MSNGRQGSCLGNLMTLVATAVGTSGESGLRMLLPPFELTLAGSDPLRLSTYEVRTTEYSVRSRAGGRGHQLLLPLFKLRSTLGKA